VLAFVEGIYGPRGIYLLPLFHPTVENVDMLISDLLLHLSPLMGRPVYLAVRSYQSWIENALESLQTQAGERQALLVKHLAHTARVCVQFSASGHRKRQTGTDRPNPDHLAGSSAAN
jgi:hypothetical protein